MNNIICDHFKCTQDPTARFIKPFHNLNKSCSTSNLVVHVVHVVQGLLAFNKTNTISIFSIQGRTIHMPSVCICTFPM